MTNCTVTSNEELASAFIVGTCQLIPKLDSPASDRMLDLIVSYDATEKQYSLLCGSFAEFYIRPLNNCIDDVDVINAKADELVFSGDFPVLPRDRRGLADTIRCFKIVPYDECPSFVGLRDMGEIKYNWKCKKFELHQSVYARSYISINMDQASINSTTKLLHKWNRSTLTSTVCGPAIKSQSDAIFHLPIDIVCSLFCPQWPREAQHWTIRPRQCGWPTIHTICEVVQNGCHVVYVQHRSCRDDKLQWRLSFSLAELILLQSWTQIQQIVYHLLRFFAKRELLQKDCAKEDEVLCTYHIKTLMLWACELKSPKWWISSSVIAICCDLLKMLSRWVKRKYCPNYFVPEANLFSQNPNFTVGLHLQTERRLSKFHKPGILCDWFVKNYILPIIRTQFQLFNFGKVAQGLCFMDYLLPLLEFRRATELQSLNLLFSFKYSDSYRSNRFVIKFGLCSGVRQHLKVRQFASFDPRLHSTHSHISTSEKMLCFKYYNNLLYILHAAHGLHYEEISWDGSLFVELVTGISMHHRMIRSQYHNFPKTYETESSRFQFLRAQGLMENLTGSDRSSEFQLLSLMSMGFLRKALEYDDSKSNGIVPAALAYLAAFYFATSEYKQAIRCCLEICEDQTSREEKESLNAGCLMFIDDVARIVGLCVLYTKITEDNLHYSCRRPYLDLRLSPEVFAFYLTALSGAMISNPFPDSTFPMDKYVKALIKPNCAVHYYHATRQIVYRRTVSSTTEAVDPMITKERVIDILMEYALDNMILFYEVIRKDFGIQCNTADCYRALYLYRSCHYDEVIHLCERILQESDLRSDLKELGLANVLLVPPLDSFFDTDTQSLLGFHTLFYYLSPSNDVIGKFELGAKSTFAHWFARRVCFASDELSESLTNQLICVKCYYFLGRHFLARYLKVRCYIDSRLQYARAMREFAAKKISYPFEYIIRTFLLRKLRLKKIGELQ